MALRQKTIRVPVNFGAPADVSDAVLTTLGTPTVYIPERNAGGSAVTFLSVMMFVAYQDVSTATGATLSEFRANVSVNGAGATTFTETDDLANTGENIAGVIGPIDFTSHFTANFGAANSRTCQVQAYFDISTGTGLNVRGVYAWIDITYEFDDTATSALIKTICFPLSEISGALGTTANVAVGTIPILTGGSGILPEASPVIRHAWVVVRGNVNGAGGTTAFTMTWGFDTAGGGVTTPSIVQTLASDQYVLFQADVSALSSTASHTFDLWSSLATRMHNVVVELWVTYEFTISGTTRVLNYAEYAFHLDSPTGGTTTGAADRIRVVAPIVEPGTITTRRKAVQIEYSATAAATMQVKVGSQASYRAYASTAALLCGGLSLQHRFDSGSSGGDGQTLARGENVIDIDVYRSAGTTFGVSGVVRLLYESDVSSDGIEAHTKVVRKTVRTIDFTAITDTTFASQSFPIPESDYWINCVSIDAYSWLGATGALQMLAYLGSGEGPEAGWKTIGQFRFDTDAELGCFLQRFRVCPHFNRHPSDPDASRMDIETARSLRFVGVSNRLGLVYSVTYHSMLFDFAGTVSGSGGGSVSINVCRADTGERIETTSRTGNGAYTAVVHDDVLNYFAEAREGANYLGRSDNTVGA